LNALLALEFPPVSHLLEWPDFALKGNEYFAFNKIALLSVLAALFSIAVIWFGARKAQLVPTRSQTLAESVVEFVRENVVMQTMGAAGLGWMPFLTSVFLFIFFCNIVEIIPGIQMPVTARMAIPATLALLVWVLYNAVGIKKQGFFGYLKSSLLPPGVPKALLPLVMLIEFVSTFLIRPFSLAVRLFANMLAGHLLLVTFAVLTAAVWSATPLALIVPVTFATLVALTMFEVLVAVLQAFIFTILTAVYINLASHADH